MKDAIIQERWQVTRKELTEFQKWYKKQNRKTQDKIQEIVNNYDISYDDLSKTIKKKEKERLQRQIEEWEELGIFTGYFKYRVEELMKGRITYRSLLEILFYGAYEEEKAKVNEETNELFYSVSLDCYNQGRKDLDKKEKKEFPNNLLKAFYGTLIGGIMFEDYVNALYLTNMQEIQKQYIISLQQNRKLDVDSDSVQAIFTKQRNRFISTDDDKYSGGLDRYATACGNMAYYNASDDGDSLVKFVSDHCEHVTEMCEYMDGMIFHTQKRNIFKRPIGRTQKDLTIQELDVFGLVLGINMPPIDEHFHWCHSTLTYQTDKTADELREMIFEKEFERIFEDEYFEEFEKLDKTNENLIYYDLDTEKVIAIEKGGKNKVKISNPVTLMKLMFAKKDSLVAVHNHPSNLSFSLTDFKTFNNSKELKGIVARTDEYIYLLSVGKGSKLKSTKANMKFMEKKFNEIESKMNLKTKTIDKVHERNKLFAKEMGWKYERRRNKE